jgi:hypothetical protein
LNKNMFLTGIKYGLSVNFCHGQMFIGKTEG